MGATPILRGETRPEGPTGSERRIWLGRETIDPER
jgi:hypothetical protein